MIKTFTPIDAHWSGCILEEGGTYWPVHWEKTQALPRPMLLEISLSFLQQSYFIKREGV
jgi:hypothetical protein